MTKTINATIKNEQENKTTLGNFLHNRSIQDALNESMDKVRTKPSDAKARWILFQLFCLLGLWERALKQLQKWAQLSPTDTKHEVTKAQLYRGLIQSELLRQAVFCGERTPGFLDNSAPEWVSDLLTANKELSNGNILKSDELRFKALSAAPASAGTGSTTGDFLWLTDSDTRLGPICEIMLAGGYRWIPFESIKKISITIPSNLIDLVWCQASLVLRNNSELKGYLPVRYPNSEKKSDNICLGRSTEWEEFGESGIVGFGQKTWSTDQGDWGIFEISECQFDES